MARFLASFSGQACLLFPCPFHKADLSLIQGRCLVPFSKQVYQEFAFMGGSLHLRGVVDTCKG